MQQPQVERSQSTKDRTMRGCSESKLALRFGKMPLVIGRVGIARRRLSAREPTAQPQVSENTLLQIVLC